MGLAHCIARLAPCVLRLASCALRLVPCAVPLVPCILRFASFALRLAPRALPFAPCVSQGPRICTRGVCDAYGRAPGAGVEGAWAYEAHGLVGGMGIGRGVGL